jgi:hypothetical protein
MLGIKEFIKYWGVYNQVNHKYSTSCIVKIISEDFLCTNYFKLI